ncbi:DUF2956 domain-containing protein [Pontibacterium granulatum]|uniref:DUF2956 domain-containing protein n=1 Tax=Pontibacterium granulatum TaxID=2036029 RepID=UPI00249B9726|nr:DUF2956 domain-containing protein [Pontibacterium granulatum]MDI3326281.1 DUF2956 domain-containing protein [Pontibacterium granulatum]
MAKSPRKEVVSDETKTDALKIARATQKPGQTKEQTKLIAQGIEKGIAQYKKQQKAKARELDRQRKKEKPAASAASSGTGSNIPTTAQPGSKLPWILLLLSWLAFAAYLFQQQGN